MKSVAAPRLRTSRGTLSAGSRPRLKQMAPVPGCFPTQHEHLLLTPTLEQIAPVPGLETYRPPSAGCTQPAYMWHLGFASANLQLWASHWHNIPMLHHSVQPSDP